MFVLGNVVLGLARVADLFLRFYFWVMVGRAIISWVNADPRNPIVRFLVMATEPPMRMIRRMLPMSLRYFPLDISFLILLGIIYFLQVALVGSLVQWSMRLR